MFKKGFCSIIVFTLAVTLLLSGCGQKQDAKDSTDSQKDSGSKTILRVSNMYAEDTSFGEALNMFKKEVEKQSNGTIEVQLFHDGSLGGEKDVIQAMRSGSVEMMFSGTAGAGLYVPEFQVFELPYLYKDMNQLKNVATSLKDQIGDMMESKGFTLLGYFYDGPRNILSTKPIHSLKDMNGLKFRVPTSTLYTEMAKALGAKPVSMPLGEIYTSFETGAIDAMEQSADNVYRSKYYEKARYYVLDKHIYQVLCILVNNDAWNKLSDDQKSIAQMAIDNASNYQMKAVQESNNQALENMKQAGTEIIELDSLNEFKNAVQNMNSDFVKSLGSSAEQLYNNIKEATK